MCALAVNTLDSTPVEVEEVVEEVLDIHFEKPLLGFCKVQVSTLKPGIGLKLASVWHLIPRRSPSLLELRLNRAKTLTGGIDFVFSSHLIQKD